MVSIFESRNRNHNFFKSRNRNHNFSKVGTGTVKNSYGSSTLLLGRFILLVVVLNNILFLNLRFGDNMSLFLVYFVVFYGFTDKTEQARYHS
jgi:hypothetical protein